MIAQWMASALASSALVGVAAACVERAIAGRIAARRFVWLVAILYSVVTPFIVYEAVVQSPEAKVAEEIRAIGVNDLESNLPPVSHTLDVALMSTWIVASTLFALVLIATYAKAMRTLRRAPRRSIGDHDVNLTDDFGPAVIGIRRPHVVIPAWTLQLPLDEQTLIVAHEAEHIRARDPLLAFSGLIFVVAMPWNFPLWWQLARLRLAIEVDCDARVVRRAHGSSTTYAQMLLDASEHARAVRHPALALAHSRSSLRSRLEALLAPTGLRIVRRSLAATIAFILIANVAAMPGPRGFVAFAHIFPSRAQPVPIAVISAGHDESPQMGQIAAPIAPRASSKRTPAARGERRPTPESVDRIREAPIAQMQTMAVPPARVIEQNATADLVVRASPLPRRGASAGMIRARSVAPETVPASPGHVFYRGTADTASAGPIVRRRVSFDSVISAVAIPVIRPRADSIRPPALNP